ncbi:MAG: FxLYD domain-containing protein [Cyanobacteria bacterium P01_F01_bin.13]
MGRDRIIEAYIQRLLAWEKPITSSTLRAIAKEVGITGPEVDAISLQAKAHFTRGRNYIEFDCLNDAIEELTQAMALDPINLDVLHSLAHAYYLRYNREGDISDRQWALMVAKRCVELKPNDKEALVLISFLEHAAEKPPKRVFPQWAKRKVTILGSGFVIGMLGIIGLSRLPVFSRPEFLGPAPGTIPPGAAVYDTGESLSALTTANDPIDIDLSADVDIPVAFKHPGLVLEARLSELGDYEDAVYYQLQGVFINVSDQEVKKLSLNVEFLDRNQVAIVAAGKEAISADDAILRPGDTHSFSLIQKVTPQLSDVQLSVTSLEQAPARKTYVPPTPINYTWDSSEPENISFELASRSEELGLPEAALLTTKPAADGSDTGKADSSNEPILGRDSFNAEWIITNTSDYPIRELMLRADFYNDNNQRLQTEEIVAIHNNDAPLLPGEVRPFRVIKSVASNYERYEVTVLEAE